MKVEMTIYVNENDPNEIKVFASDEFIKKNKDAEMKYAAEAAKANRQARLDDSRRILKFYNNQRVQQSRIVVLDLSYILGGEASHMLAILQDGFVKEFIICVKYDYNDQELEPIVFLEVRSNMNVYGFGEKVYETKGNCTL
jgi:hypothetical protein